MIYGLVGLFILFLITAPFLWVKYVLWRHGDEIQDMPGTGAELANHLVERFQLTGVSVVEGRADENYYSPNEKTVCLETKFYNGKSLSAVAVAAHEVGHAIQFIREEQVSQLRNKYLPIASIINKTGITILMAVPLVAGLLRFPSIGISMAAIGVVTMLSSVFMYVAILPEEYDASFKKALPILAEGYIPNEHMKAIRQVLKACALTYVAGALIDVLRLWRWVTLLR